MRKTAFKILNKYETDGSFINLLLKEHLKPELDSRDKGFITEIVYGVVRYKRYLDFRISKFSKTKVKKLSIPLLNILRMGFYQFDFMNKVPDFAVINESVKLAEKFCYKSKGMVNGILRSSLNSGIPDMPLAVKYSFTDEITNLIFNQYGDKTEEILINLNKKKPVVIRPNTLKTDIDKLFTQFPDSTKENGYLITDSINLAGNDLFNQGYFSVQSISSQMAVRVLNPQKNEIILDACSSPGGKTVYIAELMKNSGEITAVELHKHRCKLVESNLKRCGITNTAVINADSSSISFDKKFDKILIDAPCSGLGVICTKPDIKWQDFNFPQIIEIQYKILDNCAKVLKKDGILVYSTCTINKDENINQINKFLSENKDFKLLPFDIENKSYDGYAEILPVANNIGFFIARLTKYE